MKKSALIGTALLSAATVAAGIGMIALPHAYASWEWRGYRGDLNHDGVVSMVDIVKMQRYLLRLDSLQGEDILQRADLNQDHVVNVTDLMMLKHCVLYEDFLEIWEEITDTTTVTSDTTAPVTTTTETTTTTTDTTDAEDATFNAIHSSSQGFPALAGRCQAGDFLCGFSGLQIYHRPFCGTDSGNRIRGSRYQRLQLPIRQYACILRTLFQRDNAP